ncbi:hypothetical protein H0E87_014802, partial [Populus deltoides]
PNAPIDLLLSYTEPRPNYSAFQEASFGHATLEIKNRTRAYYTWHRNHDSEAVAAGSLWLYNRHWLPAGERSCKNYKKGLCLGSYNRTRAYYKKGLVLIILGTGTTTAKLLQLIHCGFTIGIGFQQESAVVKTTRKDFV